MSAAPGGRPAAGSGRSAEGSAAGGRSAGRSRRLVQPRPASVRIGRGGEPVALAGRLVDSVREEWVVEDRWWTSRPLRRRYFELVLDDGRNAVVFRDLVDGRWFSQRV
jgi:hypothetical protein